MDRDKLESMMAQVRETAVEANRAIKASKKRKEAEAASRSEAEPETPTQAGKQWYYDEVIEKGTALERAQLAIKHSNSKQGYSMTGQLLTDEQEELLKKKISKSPKAKKLTTELQNLVACIMTYAKTLQSLRKQWQHSAAVIATLCEEWRGYEHQAELLTLLVAEWKERKEPLSDEEIKKRLKGYDSSRVKFKYLPEEAKIVADIDGRKGLYHLIKEEQRVAIYSLRTLRSAIELFSDFAYSTLYLKDGGEVFILNILPQIVENMMEYPDSTPFQMEDRNLQYFAFPLRRLREEGKGDTITPEMEKKAVIPDYNQVEELPEVTRNLKLIMKHTIPLYNPNDYE